MDNRRNSIIDPAAGGNGPDIRSQLNTTTLPKPQQRAPEFNQRQPRPEFYQQQGPYGAPLNRPPVQQQQQQQQRPPPPQQQQQQQPRAPGDKVSPWNIIRQTLPPEATFRGGPAVPPAQQRPPQYYNMQQRPPPPQPPQEQQQYRQQQPPPPMQERRPTLSRIEDRPPFRPENGRSQGRPVSNSGGGGDDDEEVVVNTSTNQQPQLPPPPPPPPLNRRDSTVYAGGAGRGVVEGGDPNRQWQRPPVTAGPVVPGPAHGPAPYGKPAQSQEQPYGRQAIPEGQEQPRYPPAAGNYNNRQQQENNQQKPLTRRDSVLDATAKGADPGPQRRTDMPAEYGRRPPPKPDVPEDGGRRPSDLGGKRPPQPQPPQSDLQENVRRPVELENVGGRRLSDHRNSRPEATDYGDGKLVVNKDDRPSARDYVQQQQQQQQQPQTDRKVSQDRDFGPKTAAVEQGGNRASELRKLHFEATHQLKPAKEQLSPRRGTNVDSRIDGRTALSKEPVPRAEDAATVKPKDYAAAVAKPSGEDDPNKTVMSDDIRNRDEPYKYTRPDTLKIIKDNEPFKDSSNSKGDNDVGKSPSKIPKKDRPELKTPTRAVTPKSPAESVMSAGQKKLPMNKVQVGSAPSPNLKVVRSKIGSLDNTSYKPGGGQVKIENRKLEWKAGTRIVAKNDTYVPGGGDKKIQSVKLQWNAKPKVGSLDNKTHKPGGGDKKIETVKLDFKDKAKPKIGSKDNIKHTPGGGAVKIEDQKLEIKAQSKVGSMDNMKHRPGGGEVKIFDDKSYIKQTAGQMGTPTKSQLQRSSSLKLYNPDERPKGQVKIVVTPTSEEDLYTKIRTDINKNAPRSANSRSTPLLQNSIVIPEEEVRSKK